MGTCPGGEEEGNCPQSVVAVAVVVGYVDGVGQVVVETYLVDSVVLEVVVAVKEEVAHEGDGVEEVVVGGDVVAVERPSLKAEEEGACYGSSHCCHHHYSHHHVSCCC